MPDPPFDKPKAHPWFAVELYNRAWELLEAKERTGAEAAWMVHAAHASCYHWLEAGNVANHARGECLVANVHAALGQGAAAMAHAGRCLELVKEHAREMADWDLAFAYDCLARAHAASGLAEEARRLRKKAHEHGAKIVDDADKKAFDAWHTAGQWHGV